jgi:hypothetical protein
MNRACSEGVVDDIMNERKLDEPYKVGDWSKAEFPDKEIIRDTGLLTCTRYLRPQIKAVDESVDLVLMTGGGNDAGFATIIQKCFVLGLRSMDACREAVDFAHTVLDNHGTELVATFAKIRSLLKSEARVVLVSYTHLLLDIASVLEDDKVHYDAGTAIRALNNRANKVQQEAFYAANAAAGKDYIVYFERTKNCLRDTNPIRMRESRTRTDGSTSFSKVPHPNGIISMLWI